MILAALFGLYRLFKTTDKLARTILIGQIIAIGLTLFENETVTTIGLILFMLTLVLVAIYGLTKKGIPTLKRTFIVGSTALLFLTLCFQLQHYPGAGILGLTLILPIIAYIIMTTTDIKNYGEELGFMTIIAVAATIEFVERIDWMIE